MTSPRDASGSAQLNVSELTRQFDPPAGPTVLSRVSFQAAAGETLAIVGPSGSGKSTLLNIIGALDKPTSGTVRLGDLNVTALSADQSAAYRASKIGFVFQDHHLLPQLTGIENVLMPTLALKNRPRDHLRERAEEMLERVGVLRRAHAFPAELSGGERQRVAVARALINSPKLLLCDEPTGNLDHENALKVVELFAEIARTQKVIVVMVTHNLELAARFARCYRLVDGQLKNNGHVHGVMP